MESEKTLIEFLELLQDVTFSNIVYMRAGEKFRNPYNRKYGKELSKVCELINSFGFKEEQSQDHVK